jgi:hypothetical protein
MITSFPHLLLVINSIYIIYKDIKTLSIPIINLLFMLINIICIHFMHSTTPNIIILLVIFFISVIAKLESGDLVLIIQYSLLLNDIYSLEIFLICMPSLSFLLLVYSKQSKLPMSIPITISFYCSYVISWILG